MDYEEYGEAAEFTGDEVIESYEGLGYDDDMDGAGEGDSEMFEPQYPDNVMVVPDDDDRLG